MLIQCPKCGFSQPKDNYCAKCGVDMENYQPVKKRGSARFWQNPVFHIFLLGGLIFGITHFIQFREKSELKNRISMLKGEKSSVSSHLGRLKGEFNSANYNSENSQNSDSSVAANDAASSPSGFTNDSGTNSANADIATNESSGGGADTTGRAALTNNGTGTGNEGREIASVKKSTPNSELQKVKINVLYAEVKTEALDKVIEAANQAGHALQLPEGSFSIVGKTTDSLALKPVILEKVSRNFGETQSPQWFLGAQDPESGSAVGLTTSVSLDKDENDIFSGQIEVLRTLNEGEAGMQKKSFVAPFEAYARQAMIMSGIISPQPVGTESTDWMKQSLLRVFFSNEFQAKTSSFVIFFEFQRD